MYHLIMGAIECLTFLIVCFGIVGGASFAGTVRQRSEAKVREADQKDRAKDAELDRQEKQMVIDAKREQLIAITLSNSDKVLELTAGKVNNVDDFIKQSKDKVKAEVV